MPKPLSKIRESNRSEFDSLLQHFKQIDNTPEQPKPINEMRRLSNSQLELEIKSHLSTSESRIIEGIKEWAKSVKKPEWKGFGGYDEGFNDALFDLTTFLDEGLTGNK